MKVTRLFRSESEAPPDTDNAFALRLFAQLRQQPGNLFFSPFSLRTAFGMAYAGARGETAAQMGKVLGTTLNESRHSELAKRIQDLSPEGAGGCELTVANSLWAQDGLSLQREFLDVVERFYEGALNSADFARAADEARLRINQWVEDKTRGKIQDLIPPGILNELTRVVLVNAVYFKGKWVLQFKKAATHDEPFLTDGGEVTAPLMHQCEQVSYGTAKGYRAVDLSYQGDDLSLLILLPDRKDGLSDLETHLSVKSLEDCIGHMKPTEVDLFLPRFKITWGTVDFCDAFKALGMTLPFGHDADFSGINGRQPPDAEALYISSVLHKAFVEVNEEGTEAAAATAISMVSLAMPSPFSEPKIPVFRADHPFLFAIRHRQSGTILFLGRMADPS